MGLGALGSGLVSSRRVPAAPVARGRTKPPNVLFIISDQLGLDALGAHGNAGAHTPNLDRLVRRGVSFMLSHSTNPVCSPARSSLFTGRMPTETGVITNGRPIHASLPNLGQWLHQNQYETMSCGKWHLPEGYPIGIPGFTVLPVGGAQGDLCDPIISRTFEAYVKSRSHDRPFFFVASFVQPHDICYWAIWGKELVPEQLAFPSLTGRLPSLPPNHRAAPAAPARLGASTYTGFSEAQWRYYLYVYDRQVEMLDAEVGRLLDALEESEDAENTIVLFTSDHGEGRGRHMHVQKWYPYEEAVKVPLVIAWPGEIPAGHRDDTHLVSGLDIMRTVCDYAGVTAPEGGFGRSLRPLLETKPILWREHLVMETQLVGRAVRTAEYKYVRYQDDPVEQLFDMKGDPWETRNLYQEAKYAEVIRDHRKLLDEWESRLERVEPTPEIGVGRPRGARRT